jgi:hypothetical protein
MQSAKGCIKLPEMSFIHSPMAAHPPANMQVVNQVVYSALTTTMHALRCSMHHALGMSPGAFVYQRDMFLNIPLITNLQTIQDHRQLLIDENLGRQNLKRPSFDYVVNQEVLVIKVPNPRKLDDKAEGPYTIRQVHMNGTITVQCTEQCAGNELIFDK